MALVRRHAGVAFCHTRVGLPPDVGARLRGARQLRGLGARSTVTVIGLLDAELDDPIREAVQQVVATACTDELAAVLGVPTGRPLLRIERLYRDSRGRAIEYAVSHFDPARYTYRVRPGRHPG